MDLKLWIDRHGRLTCRLMDEGVETEVTAAHGAEADGALAAALEDARESGYGECFWREATGQYWWMLHRQQDLFDVVVMWSRGGATGWQHAFRATAPVAWFVERLREERARLG